MMHVPALVEPVGDPAGVRVAVRRLLVAAESVGGVARGLSDLNQQAVQAWESQAQRLFSILADGYSQVVAGSGGVASELAAALDRFANILESCQGEVRLCRQRLDDLVASTPVGFAPDPVAVNSLVGQANQAQARAIQAARELSATALKLIGGPSAHGQVPIPGNAHASFVSQAHTGGLASTHPSAAAFNAQAAQIQSQMTRVMGSLTGLVASGIPQPHAAPSHFVINPEALNPTPTVMINPEALNPTPTVMINPEALNPTPTVMIDPRFTNGQLIFSPAGQSLFIQIQDTPFIETPDGALLAAAYETGNPALIGLAQYSLEIKHQMIDDWTSNW